MKKRKFHITFFSGAVLLLLVILLFSSFIQKDKSTLFRSNHQTTLYETAAAGEEPDFRTQDYFTDETYDYDKFTYDTSGCDFQTPGTYYVPVYYDGKKTNCTVQVTVEDRSN